MWEARRETAGGNRTRTASGCRRTSFLQALLLARCVTVRKSLSFSELGFLVCQVELITVPAYVTWPLGGREGNGCEIAKSLVVNMFTTSFKNQWLPLRNSQAGSCKDKACEQ